MAIDISQTSPAQWRYISEGNVTIVFSYNGPHHPTFTGKALRIRKAPRETQGPHSPFQGDLAAFQQNVLPRLLDPAYLPDLQTVPLQANWVEVLSKQHEPFRPQERRITSKVDCSRRTAVLVTDLIGGLTCAVELKPKWGFLPNCLHLSPETKPIKTQTCRTCMHGHLKRTEGVNAATQYCPLDLFSGSKARLETALGGLWDSWIRFNGSINSLRIFNHGKVVLPDDELTLRAWSRETFSLPTDAPITSIKSSFINSLLLQILRTPLLNRISSLQRSLDSLDCEGLAKLIEISPIFDLTQPTMEDWASFVDTFLSPKHQNHSDFSPTNLRYHSLSYALSATFKDCSLIIPLHSDWADDEHGDNIKVVDLEIKSVENIPRWLKLDQRIVNEYAKLEQTMRKSCIE
ncbi:inositol-pentakisphosphate 2-kinase [Russula earlei]|uniref:Inositol-pentakisphosphate 2-kinase n=1 Tax=Russula earlei TaxID=71964 RepID=A0ACC0U876_9AGAM|nr:inositol-pentakisphosphate 2-kinase [Russula earlei]